MNYVYHGSSIPNLEVIKKHKSTHMKEWVYACHSKGIATIFLSNKVVTYFIHYLEMEKISSRTSRKKARYV